MFVGHALLAFAIAALFAERRGWPARRALALGVAAGAFAALPDVDVVYALFALDGGRFVSGGAVDPEAFWAVANSVHRSMTHSLIVALAAGPAFGLLAARATGGGARGARRAWVARALAAVILAGLVAVALGVSGPLGGVVMAAFVGGGAALAALIRRRTDLSPLTVAVAATFGLVSHPWGDLVTGSPPQMLYPFGIGLFDGRVVLHPDPTLHLLGAFALELATVWLAALAVVRVTGRPLRTFYDPSAALGAAYGVVPLVLVPPTLEVSYHFVFSIIAVGAFCAALSWYRRSSPSIVPSGRSLATPSVSKLVTAGPPVRPPDAARVSAGLPFAAIGLAGVTVALVGYAVVYVTFLG